jgi:hypothetical protein
MTSAGSQRPVADVVGDGAGKPPIRRYSWAVGATCVLLGIAVWWLSLHHGRVIADVVQSGASCFTMPGACQVLTLNKDGTCAVAPVQDGAACESDQCTAGACQSGKCVLRAVNEGQLCQSDVPTNGCLQAVCTNGQCLAQTVSCDDSNSCTTDWCDPQSGCQHDAIPSCVAAPTGGQDDASSSDDSSLDDQGDGSSADVSSLDDQGDGGLASSSATD